MLIWPQKKNCDTLLLPSVASVQLPWLDKLDLQNCINVQDVLCNVMERIAELKCLVE